MSEDFLAPQVIYQGKTSACHDPEYDFPLAWNITHSPNHWANTDTQMEYTSRVLVPHMDKTKKKLGLPNTQKSLCIFNVFRAQMSREFVDDLKTKNIEIVYTTKHDGQVTAYGSFHSKSRERQNETVL